MEEYPFLTISQGVLYALSIIAFMFAIWLMVPELSNDPQYGIGLPRLYSKYLGIASAGASFLIAGSAEMLKLTITQAINIQKIRENSEESLELFRKIEITTKYTGKKMIEADKRRNQ